MSQTIDDIKVSTEWVSVNLLTSIPVGVAMKIQNKGIYTCILAEGVKPEKESTNGERINTKYFTEQTKYILKDSLEIWARIEDISLFGAESVFSVQRI